MHVYIIGDKYTYIHAFVHIYMYMYVIIYIYGFVHICTHTYVFNCTYIHIFLNTYVHIYIYTYIYVYIRTYVCVCTHLYLLVYIYACISERRGKRGLSKQQFFCPFSSVPSQFKEVRPLFVPNFFFFHGFCFQILELAQGDLTRSKFTKYKFSNLYLQDFFLSVL